MMVMMVILAHPSTNSVSPRRDTCRLCEHTLISTLFRDPVFPRIMITYVDDGNSNAKHCDPNGDVEVRSPVAYDESCAGQIGRCREDIFEEVIPSTRKSGREERLA